MTDVQEQRQFSRIAFDARATVKQGDHQWQTTVADLSLKGILVKEQTDNRIDPEPGVTVIVELDKHSTITMEGHLAHSENGRCGIRCEHIDLDSITHLRRLVELNLGNEALLERELSRLG